MQFLVESETRVPDGKGAVEEALACSAARRLPPMPPSRSSITSWPSEERHRTSCAWTTAPSSSPRRWSTGAG
jgi:hypothetical protein